MRLFIFKIVFVFTLISGLLQPASAMLAAADAEPANPNGSSIHGFVWTDLNNNGEFDIQEPVVHNETVFVTPDVESDFAQVLVLTTDAQGEFSASSLTPGRYLVWAAAQSIDAAMVVTVTADRAVMTINLPLVGFILYMPQITR
ncbi:MAG: SdrD B-like domain-containing protein [Caldilineaceae bacterium]